MTNDVSRLQKCIVMRNGIEVWTDAEKADRFGDDCVNGFKGVVRFDGRFLNTADLIGVFFPLDMEDLTRRKNGQWKCREGNWHDRNTKCSCIPSAEKEYAMKKEAAIRACGKCQNGFIPVRTENGGYMAVCDCVKNIK